MASHDPAPRTLTLEGPVLTRRALAALTAQIDAEGSAAPWVIDCHAVLRVEPDGLCALLDLAQTRDTSRWALAALAPELLRAAVEVGLAEGYAICSDAAAARALLLSGDAATCGR